MKIQLAEPLHCSVRLEPTENSRYPYNAVIDVSATLPPRVNDARKDLHALGILAYAYIGDEVVSVPQHFYKGALEGTIKTQFFVPYQEGVQNTLHVECTANFKEIGYIIMQPQAQQTPREVPKAA